MQRHFFTLAGLFTSGVIGFFCYSYLTRPESLVPPTQLTVHAMPFTQSTPVGAAHTEPVAKVEISSPSLISADTVEKWAAEAFDVDPTKRVVAIAALASAPRLQAVPVLGKVLKSGEPVDHPLALRSLRSVALQQGDDDGGIRDILRHAIYHGGDEAIVLDARDVLDEVDLFLSQNVANASH